MKQQDVSRQANSISKPCSSSLCPACLTRGSAGAPGFGAGPSGSGLSQLTSGCEPCPSYSVCLPHICQPWGCARLWRRAVRLRPEPGGDGRGRRQRGRRGSSRGHAEHRHAADRRGHGAGTGSTSFKTLGPLGSVRAAGTQLMAEGIELVPPSPERPFTRPVLHAVDVPSSSKSPLQLGVRGGRARRRRCARRWARCRCPSTACSTTASRRRPPPPRRPPAPPRRPHPLPASAGPRA